MLSYTEFSLRVTSRELAVDLAKLRVEIALTLYWYINQGKKPPDGRAVKELFDSQILKLTLQRKKSHNTAASYYTLIGSWRDGKGDVDLALSAYYWFHRAVENKQYAKRIDDALGLDFAANFPVLGKPRPTEQQRPPFPRSGEIIGEATPQIAEKVATYLRSNPTPFFLNMPESGYEFKDLLEVAQEELFVCGQNLFGLTKEKIGERYVTFEHIQRAVDRGVRVKLLICNPDEKDHIRPWSFAVGTDEYGDHLLRAAKIFRDWAAQYPNGELSVKFARFIPTSANFVDPRRPGARLATLTAHCFQPVRTARPFILLTPQADPEIYDFYFKNFDFVWDHARAPIEVEAINPKPS